MSHFLSNATFECSRNFLEHQLEQFRHQFRHIYWGHRRRLIFFLWKYGIGVLGIRILISIYPNVRMLEGNLHVVMMMAFWLVLLSHGKKVQGSVPRWGGPFRVDFACSPCSLCGFPLSALVSTTIKWSIITLLYTNTLIKIWLWSQAAHCSSPVSLYIAMYVWPSIGIHSITHSWK